MPAPLARLSLLQGEELAKCDKGLGQLWLVGFDSCVITLARLSLFPLTTLRDIAVVVIAVLLA